MISRMTRLLAKFSRGSELDAAWRRRRLAVPVTWCFANHLSIH